MDSLRKQDFPAKTIQEWKEKAEQSLKGRAIESIHNSTYENIILKPLYSQEDEQIGSNYPGGSDLKRGIYPLGYLKNEWKVAQRVSYQSVEDLKGKLVQAIENGQTAISFELSKELLESKDSLSSIISNLADKLPFAINSKSLQAQMLATLLNQTISAENVTGYIANDPISLFAESGCVSDGFLDQWTRDIRLAIEKLPHLQTILIDSTPYHNGGANAVQELGIAIAEGVYYLQLLIEKGINKNNALSKMVFQFSIGSNFFMEVAKFRAARILWNKITEIYGADRKFQGMQIATETSAFTMTVYDPHVNLLRAGNEAFSAVLGGVQYLHVAPYDDITGSTSLSERIARNIQHILKEEAQMQKVIDPAGGSWYVEELTTQLAEHAWSFFQQIEEKGGILKSLKSNWLQQEITAVYQKRNQDIQTRKQSIVGTNVYARLDEIAPNYKKHLETKQFIENGQIIESIPHRRLAQPFEALRNRAENLAEKAGNKPTIGMICLGDSKQYKTRLDFMKGFLASGGINAIESEPISSVEKARKVVSKFQVQHFCICGTNAQYEIDGLELINALKKEFPNKTFLLAGLPEKDQQAQWLNTGIKTFIHAKSNCYETLKEILSEMEVAANET
jgi:methylmalonyl-CoA mutase